MQYLQHRTGLPAIYFLFSRAACDDAVRQCTDWGLVVADEAQSVACLETAHNILEPLTAADRTVLQIDEFLYSLSLGFAAHHAGMVPITKTVVEECFAAGNLPVVFATETLAMGINMPAKTVVLERLTKYDGTTHRLLRGGDYTQLTGRAGRRGLDPRGESLILYDRWTELPDVLDLVYSTAFPLRSSFRPSYNMVANLVARHSMVEIERILRESFAQFQADERANRLIEELADLERDIEAPGTTGATPKAVNRGPNTADAGDEAGLSARERRRLRRIRWVKRDIENLRSGLIDIFRRQHSLLEQLGYLEDGGLTDLGQMLRSVHGDTELVCVEALRADIFDADPATVAAIASALVYEGRRDDVSSAHGSKALNTALQQLETCWFSTAGLETRFHLAPTRELDRSMAASVQAWANGATFATLADSSGVAPGDLVRHLRQVADLLRQLSAARPDGNFGRAEKSVMRGLVRPFDPARP